MLTEKVMFREIQARLRARVENVLEIVQKGESFTFDNGRIAYDAENIHGRKQRPWLRGGKRLHDPRFHTSLQRQSSEQNG